MKKTCPTCKGAMQEVVAKTPENIEYTFSKCTKCGEEIVNREQIHAVAEKYRLLRTYHVKLSKWGLSLGVRIPRDIVKKYKLKEEDEVAIIQEKEGIKIIPP